MAEHWKLATGSFQHELALRHARTLRVERAVIVHRFEGPGAANGPGGSNPVIKTMFCIALWLIFLANESIH